MHSRTAAQPHRTLAALVIALLIVAGTARAQNPYGSGPHDPAVPTPRAILGYEIGERFT